MAGIDSPPGLEGAPRGGAAAATPEPLGSALFPKVVKSSLWPVLGQTLTLAVSFALTPFIIRGLGAEAYGVFVLGSVLTSYWAFSDLGMGPVAARFAAKALAEKDPVAEVSGVWTSFMLVLASTGFAMLVLAAVTPWVSGRLIDVPAPLGSSAKMVIWLAGGTFVLRSAGSVLCAPQLARLRLDLQSSIAAGTNTLQTLLVLMAVLLGGGVVHAAAVVAACAGLAASLHFVVSRRLQPAFGPRAVDRPLVAPLLTMGRSLALSSLVGSVLFQGERLFLAHVTDSTHLAFYTVAYALAQMLDVVPVALTQALLPAFVRAMGEGRTHALHSLYTMSVRLVAALTLPSAVVLAVGGEFVLRLWAGPRFAEAGAPALAVLALATAISSVGHIPRTLLPAAGRADLLARVHVLELLPFVAIAVPLVWYFGVLGAACAWAARSVVEAGLVLWLAVPYTGGNLGSILRQGARALQTTVVVVGVPLLCARYTGSLAIFLVVLLASATLYGVCVWRILLPSGDREMLTWIVSSFGGRKPMVR